MNALVADTHAVIWFLFGLPNLSGTAKTAMDTTIRAGDSILVATVSLVEVAYLIEKGRLPAATFSRMDQALSSHATGFVPTSLDQDVARALRNVLRNLIPDMPDRIIAATALQLGLALVTSDLRIQASGIVRTIW